MHDIRTAIDILASTDKVWKILTDFGAYPEWNPFWKRVTGELRIGAELTVVELPPGHAERTVRVTVLEADAPRELRWIEDGTLLSANTGIVLVNKGVDRTHVVHRLTCTGPFSGMKREYRETTLREGIDAMNRALKARAQAR